ncbi:T9SS type B sorting domain-containing protein [Algibacter mikhailovii]|nr:T9SS type B sorting domain-containing protein [Algibacter mikhailovii]
MKKPTCSNYVFVITLLLLSMQLFSQNLIPFNPRFDQAIKGDILLIGNSNVGLHVSDPYNGTDTNDRLDAAVFVDIDGDPSTFNSSSADLDVPNDVTCYRVVYAGLYWSAVVDGDTPISDIKFKTPGGSYVDISGTEIYFQDADTDRYSNTYAYYHDVTDMLTALPDPEGTYSVANISSMVGPKPNSEGLSAGWSLFVVYEDPLLPSKYITSFDGFTKITSTINETIPVSGFETIPTGPVRAKYAFSTIEGDRRWTGDYLLLNGTPISATNNAGTIIREEDNFFNSTSSIIDPLTNTPEIMTTRLPDGSNTLGFDSGIINVPNAGNTLISNGATSATISLGSNLDIYYFYFNAFAIEIIAPNIVLTKIVEDEFGNDIGGQIVDLGDELFYTIGFQNTGNDDATDLTIRDIIPTNIVFNYPEDIEYLPPGVTVQSYNPTTRELIFRVDRDVVEENDPVSSLKFKVTVVSTCSLLSDACSNNIDNQAYATYKGTINPDFVISDDPSFNSSSGCLLTPGATNFLADINDCTFEEEVILCGENVQLTAGNGYDKYSWSTSPTGVPVIGTSQTITVTSTGTYYVHNTAVAPCQDTDQIFEVITFGANVTNPVIPFADEVVTCPNDGKELPNIFLCGTTGARLIQTNISDTTSMIWEKLDESSCTAVVNQDCANEDLACTWNQVATGPDFMADTAGQYRLTMNYTGGCFNQFYFNIYTNLLVPTVTKRDIYCATPGEIVVGGVPNGYEYSIDGVNYQTSNTFSITTARQYSIYLRQIGVTPNPCIFEVPDVQIVDHDFTVSSIISQPLCYGDLGSVSVAANDARPQYYFSISEGSTLIDQVGPISQNNYTFSNLNPGTYTLDVSTDDGCVFSGDIEIIQPPLLEATSALTTPLTCTDGEITVYPVGGTPPYYYFVNSTTVFQSTPLIAVTSAGVYNITVVDSNNCTAETSITVEPVVEPDFNVITSDILCTSLGDSGLIEIDVTNANGNSLEYSIDNGTTFVSSPVFSGLSAGIYNVVIQYGIGSDVCTSLPQTVSINTADPLFGTAVVTVPFTCISNGEISVSGVTGGTAPYSYSIDGINFQNGSSFSGLTDGSYTVYIRDASTCVFISAPVEMEALSPPTDLSFVNTPLSCPLNVTDVSITTTGGNGTLNYEIIAPASATSNISGASNGIFTGLMPGTYTFQVTDEFSCSYSESYTIAPLPPVTLNTVLTKDLDCTLSPEAVITGTITSGVAPFSYTVSYNGGAYSAPVPTSSTFAYTAANPGTYQIQVTDANGCSAESRLQFINAISPPEISLAQTQSNLCHGDTNAAFDVIINNAVGTPPFQINVINTTLGSNFGAQTSGLPAGNYEVTITDAKFCTDTKSIVIAEPLAISVSNSTVPITCGALGVSQGSVIIDGVTGGTAPYNYYVTGSNGYARSELNASGTTSTTFDVVDFGLYQINVVDANGCSIIVEDLLVASPPTDLLIDINTTSDCIVGGEATVSIGTTLASPGPFFFAIYKGGSTVYPNPVGDWVPEDAVNSKSATFTGLLPGVTYTFIVYDDSTKCSYYQTAEDPIPSNSMLAVTALASNNITCVGSADGNVSFTVNSSYGSSVNIDYEVWDALTSTPTGVSSSGSVGAGGSLVVSNLGALDYGNYFVVVRETSGSNAGCAVVTSPFNITESARELSISASVDKNANCNPNSGVISAVATNGTAPYVYQLSTNAIPPLADDSMWSSTQVFNADAGSYFVHVQDAYGCIRTIPSALIISQDTQPEITATLNNQCTVTEGNFAIDIALTTPGIPPYSYSVDGGVFQTRSIPFTITNLNSGMHTVEILDANGCGNLATIDVQAPIDIMPAVVALPTCNDNDGQIEITATGGSGTFSYQISPNPASAILSSNVYSGLPSGSYTVTIIDDLTLCEKDATIFLSEPQGPIVTAVSSPVTCFNENGIIDIDVQGYSGTYTYEVFNSLGVSVLTGAGNTSLNPQQVNTLMAGNYSVVITETLSPFCTGSTNVIIESPAEALSLVASETSNVTCDNNQGTIVASANGGWGDYQYELTGAATVAYSASGTFTGLAAGMYTVNVLDAGGCIASANTTLILPTIIDGTIAANANMLSCFGDTNGSINVMASGGQGSNYTYTLNQLSPTMSSSGPQTTPLFEGLGVGTYNVLISDGYNCDFTTTSISITEPTEIESLLVKETSQTCFTNSTLTLSATGGVGPYTFSDSPSFANVLGSFTASTTLNVSEGTYVYYVRDANGCVSVSSNEITINPLPTLEVNIDATNATINCTGDNSGVIVALAQGGLGSYNYTLQDASGTDISPAPVQTTPGVFTELPAGTYQVSVTSGLDCEAVSAQISITEPSAALTADFSVNNVSCNGGDDGMIEILASGGTGIIKYAISPQLNQFFDTPVFNNLVAGDYQAIAQDELGCFVIFDFTIIEPTPVLLSIVPNSMVSEICSGDLDAAFSIEISGGTLPYSVSLDDIAGTYFTGNLTQNVFDFDNLNGGDHIVYVRDSEGCESEWNITFPDPVLLDPQVLVEYGCVNNSIGNTVTVTIDASTDATDVDYSLNNGPFQTSNVFTNIVSGIGHSITVRHTNGCEQSTLSFDINDIEPLELDLKDGGINEIVAQASGGTEPYEYSLNGVPQGEENTFIIYESGNYTVTVMDSNGCTAEVTRYFEYIDICIPNFFTPSNGDKWGPGCADQYRELTYDIFDRYGRKIATLDLNHKWDGTYNGAELPTGDYWYVVKLNDATDNRDFVGHFTLYR